MPRLNATQQAPTNSAPMVDPDTGEVFDALALNAIEEYRAGRTHPLREVVDAEVVEEQQALVLAEHAELAPVVERALTEQEVLLNWGAYEVPLTVEERRLYLIAQSGVYKSVRKLSQALTLSELAKTLNISEHAAFSGVYIMSNGMSMSAHLIGALVRKSGVYDYKVVEMTPEKCEIVWFKHEKEIGRSEFTTEQARKNGSVKPMSAWAKTPDEMCRNRALTRGCRTYCGEVFAGAGVYTPEELEEAL